MLVLQRLLAFGPLSASLALASTDDCSGLQPHTDAFTLNYFAILGCLESAEATVHLLPGEVYLLHRGFTLPPDSRVLGPEGAADQRPILQINGGTGITNFVVKTQTNSTLSAVVLDAAENLLEGSATALLQIEGSYSKVSDVEVFNSRNTIGVYFGDHYSIGNVLSRVHVHHVFYGVIFAHGLRSNHPNVFEDGLVEDVDCDAFTLAGYGQVVGSMVRRNGLRCRRFAANGSDIVEPPSGDGSITPLMPGAGFLCFGNVEGGEIVNNTAYDNCGMAVEADECANLLVEGNMFYDPGYSPSDEYRHCQGGVNVRLVDSQRCRVLGNEISNTRASNMQRLSPLGDADNVFAGLGSHEFADLPARGHTILNFVVAHRPQIDAFPSILHQVDQNTFRASCPASELTTSECVAVGYFSGRGTGIDKRRGTGWDEDASPYVWEPSDFTNGISLGHADIGSVRCGENRYAGTTPRCSKGFPSPCNDDDYLHQTVANRNDVGCQTYANRVGPPRLHGDGRTRIPLPEGQGFGVGLALFE